MYATEYITVDVTPADQSALPEASTWTGTLLPYYIWLWVCDTDLCASDASMFRNIDILSISTYRVVSRRPIEFST